MGRRCSLYRLPARSLKYEGQASRSAFRPMGIGVVVCIWMVRDISARLVDFVCRGGSRAGLFSLTIPLGFRLHVRSAGSTLQ